MYYIKKLIAFLNMLSPVGDLLLRLYVAHVFWQSGLVKIASFTSTLWLFNNEYHVPLLNPTFAAYLGTGIELVFPVLLAFGFLGRLSAFVLFFHNILAVVSYPALGTEISDHIAWGIILLVLILRGPGKLSIDYLFARKFLKD